MGIELEDRHISKEHILHSIISSAIIVEAQSLSQNSIVAFGTSTRLSGIVPQSVSPYVPPGVSPFGEYDMGSYYESATQRVRTLCIPNVIINTCKVKLYAI